METINIRVAEGRDQWLKCWPAVRELRPHIRTEEEFLQRMEFIAGEGARMVMLEAEGVVPTVSVFRINHYLARGKNLYIDDLVSLPAYRGRGYARAMLEWIENYAIRQGCENIHLDSGHQRYDAHRLYLNFGFKITAHHFVLDITE